MRTAASSGARPPWARAGECPTCGQVIAPPQKVPWHFKMLLGGIVVYLGYRAYQAWSGWRHHL